MWHITNEELPKENKSVIVYFPRRKYYSVGFQLGGCWCFDTLMPIKSPPYAWCEFEEFKNEEKA